MTNNSPQSAALLSTLLTSFPETAGDAEARVQGYRLAISGLPFEHVKKAVARFICGDVEGHNHRFCPSTAELRAEIRRLDAADRYARSREALPAPEPELKISDEERKAVMARLRKKFPGFFPPDKE